MTTQHTQYRDSLLAPVMQDLLGDEYSAFRHVMDMPHHSAIRANSLKVSADELRLLIGQNLEPVPWCREAFYIPPDFRAGKSPLYHAGLYYIQEPSAMSAAEAIGVLPGEYVLDLCAAPGGKSTQLAAKLGGSGLLVCNDISRSRLKALVKNLELAGVQNAAVTCEEPRRLTRAFPQFFNKILIDAPCSGEGMFRKDKDVVKAYSPQKIESFARQSVDILRSAALMLAPGGQILFSTCTFNKTENEDVVEEFLADHTDFHSIEINMPGSGGFSQGFGKYGSSFRRLFPHKIRGEGHFLALLRQDGRSGTYANTQHAPSSFKNVPRGLLAAFRGFISETLYTDPFNTETLRVMGDTLYNLPHSLPNLDGIRLVKTGLRLGEFHQTRFEPSQALAMALTQRDAQRYISFGHTSAEAIKYLKGDTLELPSNHQDGWTLVNTEGHPLGWGKALRGTLKNKYNRNWLME